MPEAARVMRSTNSTSTRSVGPNRHPTGASRSRPPDSAAPADCSPQLEELIALATILGDVRTDRATAIRAIN